MKNVDLVVIGGGPAGMAAALSAREKGISDILILERDKELGGILNQCIHNGFGLHTFKEELTGPEYAARYVEMVREQQIPSLLHTMVVDVQGGEPCVVTAMNREQGMFRIQAKAVVLAMGCRERSRGAMNIPGFRPAGIYSAGTAQRYVNIEGRMPGKEIIVLGSGDIGLIMARRMKWEGADVKMVCELMPYSSGLARNIQQCLVDQDIPLKLSTTVVNIHGKERLTGVTIAQVDENKKPIPGTEEYVPCDTLLLSVGLLPENELSRGLELAMDPVTGGAKVDEGRQTSVPGVYACGNVLHVHDIVDFVSKESMIAGKSAALYSKKVKNGKQAEAVQAVEIRPVGQVRYTVPQRASLTEAFSIYCRVAQPLENGSFVLKADGQEVLQRKFLRVVPGEMQELAIGEKLLEKLKGAAEITLEVEL